MRFLIIAALLLLIGSNTSVFFKFWNKRRFEKIEKELENEAVKRLNYIIEYGAEIKVGDLIICSLLTKNDVMLVLEENINGANLYGSIKPGIIVLKNNKKFFFTKSDCLKVKIL